jgi:hypothetical protein
VQIFDPKIQKKTKQASSPSFKKENSGIAMLHYKLFFALWYLRGTH